MAQPANLGQQYAHIYLSPHSDDAALSCGGRIHQQSLASQRPLVLTFFSGNPSETAFSDFAQGQHQKWSLDEREAMALRRAEDQAALDVLGADGLYLDYLDCIYRLHPTTREPMYASEEGIFGKVDPAEAGFPLALADHVARLVGSPAAPPTLYAPLTAGHHVDHQLMRQAALLLADRGFPVAFYEDYPYAQKPDEIGRALETWPGQRPPEPRLFPLSQADLRARIRAIAEYGSQISTLFGTAEAMAAQVAAYCAHLAQGAGYAERYWVLE